MVKRVHKFPLAYQKTAFSLIELLVVITSISILLGVGIKILGGTSGQARKTATDSLAAAIELARTTAITTHRVVILAIVDPSDLPNMDERCRLGIFQVITWPDSSTTVDATQLRPWQAMPLGAIPNRGDYQGIRNPYDLPEITVRYVSAGKQTETQVHALAFTPRGGLQWPTGSDPLVIRVAEGSYRGGQATPDLRGESKNVSENRLLIGRVIARPRRID
jgi:type II secretory pathway pseudopilin PulG